MRACRGHTGWVRYVRSSFGRNQGGVQHHVGVLHPRSLSALVPHWSQPKSLLGRKLQRLGTNGVPFSLGRIISPEQAAGHDVDARSDIYSLGAVGYYLLSGRPPFLRSTPAQMYKAHLHEQPTPIATYVPAIPSDLASILHRCLEKDPAHRFTDIRELEAGLLLCDCAQSWDSEKAAQWWTRARKSPSLPVIPAEPDSGISMMHTIDVTSHPSPA